MKTAIHDRISIRLVSLAFLATGLMLAHRTTSGQVVTTFAGSGSMGSLDGNGAAASFYYPVGLSVGPSGNVYVADTFNGKIRKITPEGFVTTLAGNGRPGYDQFFAPMGVAADAFGNVWVADADDGIDGQWMKKVTPGGSIINLTLYPGFNPIAVALNFSGKLYVLDLDGGLWEASTDSSNPSSILLTTAVPAPLYGPPAPNAGVTVDAAGTVYFSNHDRIQKVSRDGTVSTLAGSGKPGSSDGAGTSASFRDPNGLAVDSSGNVYVADSGNNTIRKITPSGVVTTLAGSAGPGSVDGTGTAASFRSPAGVALDALGNLYVADAGNNKIRKITLPGSTQPCVSDATTLCLNGGRFRVTTQWATEAGQSGSGRAVALSGGDTGYFTFFDPGNVEVAVKVLNGCSANGSFWIFAGGLTDVAVGMTVTDTHTGTVRSYTNPESTPFRSIQDTTTFAACSIGSAAEAMAYRGSDGASLLPQSITESFDADVIGTCAANATTLCLNNARYQVRARWSSRDGNSGEGHVINLTGDTGAFWFFSPSNLEVMVKVLNGCGVNSRYWTFAAGLTDVNVILTVTDTQTGAVQTYTNPQGTPFEPIQDTKSFATCP